MLQLANAPVLSTEHELITLKIFEAFAPYLMNVARAIWRKYGRPNGQHGRADVESAARDGLLKAIKLWRPNESKPLIHLAAVWIATSCKAEVRRQSIGAVDVPTKIRRLCREYRICLADGNRAEGEARLRQSASRLTTCQIVRFLSQGQSHSSFSLSIPLPPGHQAPASNLDEDLLLTSAMEAIRDLLLNECSNRERLIFYLIHPDAALCINDVGTVYAKDGTLIVVTEELVSSIRGRQRATGRLLGISGQRIHQIYTALLDKIRRRLGRELRR